MTFYDVKKKLLFFQDKKFKFNKKKHTYSYDKKELKSVSFFINSISPPFKENQHILSAEKQLKKEGIPYTQEDINKLAENLKFGWDLKRDTACDNGHWLHNYIEDRLNGKIPIVTESIQDAVNRFEEFIYPRMSNLRFLGAEIRIFDLEFGYAGTLDSLFYNDEKKELYIIDWKSNENIHKKAYNNLLYGFSHIPNSKLHIYSIQQSFYRLMLQRQGIEVDDCFLVYIPIEEKDIKTEVIRCYDYRNEILKYFSKK